MPNDALGAQVEPILHAVRNYLASGKPDPRRRDEHLARSSHCQDLLSADIMERKGPYLTRLDENHDTAIKEAESAVRMEPGYLRADALRQATSQQYELLRRGGPPPRNVSPVLYVIPLLFVGVAEWYVNFSTFSAIFIPVFAISATIIVAAVFASASHLHGAYIKQLSEILNPAAQQRSLLSRKIAIVIATLLLFAAFGTVVWLRYLVISEQLGCSDSQEGPFDVNCEVNRLVKSRPNYCRKYLNLGVGDFVFMGVARQNTRT